MRGVHEVGGSSGSVLPQRATSGTMHAFRRLCPPSYLRNMHSGLQNSPNTGLCAHRLHCFACGASGYIVPESSEVSISVFCMAVPSKNLILCRWLFYPQPVDTKSLPRAQAATCAQQKQPDQSCETTGTPWTSVLALRELVNGTVFCDLNARRGDLLMHLQQYASSVQGVCCSNCPIC